MRRLLACLVAALLAGCAAPAWLAKARSRNRLVVDATPAEALDTAILIAEQLGYTVQAADRAQGAVRASARHPAARVRDYAAGSERYFGAVWRGLDVMLTVRVRPASAGDALPDGSGAAQVLVLVRADLEADGLLMGRRGQGGGLARIRFPSSGGLERQYLEAFPLALEVTRKRAGAAGRAGPQTR